MAHDLANGRRGYEHHQSNPDRGGALPVPHRRGRIGRPVARAVVMPDTLTLPEAALREAVEQAGGGRAGPPEPQAGAALVMELRRLRAAVELLAEVAALDERKPGAWSLVLHRLGRRCRGGRRACALTAGAEATPGTSASTRNGTAASVAADAAQGGSDARCEPRRNGGRDDERGTREGQDGADEARRRHALPARARLVDQVLRGRAPAVRKHAHRPGAAGAHNPERTAPGRGGGGAPPAAAGPP